VPEGDSIFRAAHTLDRALRGRTVLRFESVFPHLTRVDDDFPIQGRIVESVSARGKHLLIAFSGGLMLRTHMRMKGSWHIYRPGERWQRPGSEMRIVIGTDAYEAVAFAVPVAEFIHREDLPRNEALQDLGPDPLSTDFDLDAAVSRLESRADLEIAEALLDQHAIAGIGNIFKSETLFLARLNPFLRVGTVPRERIANVVRTAATLLRANASGQLAGITTYGGLRGQRSGSDAAARRWVYGRAGKPCRRCGTPIAMRKQGPFARSTYWCERCQPFDPAAS
jgi:endonuclease VIII